MEHGLELINPILEIVDRTIHISVLEIVDRTIQYFQDRTDIWTVRSTISRI